MPLTPKEDSPTASDLSSNVRITSEDYNLHDEEIVAIEQYIGTTGGFRGLGLGRTELPELKTFQRSASEIFGDARFLDVSGGNVFNIVAQLVDIVNNVTEFRGQGSISGYVHSGQRIILPEQAQATFLTATPNPSDTVINVQSTEGFPSSGVISILNDVQQATKTSGQFRQTVAGGVSMVEWIRYSGKTGTQFINCERGYLNTARGPHSASFDSPRETNFNRNRKDFCVLLDSIETQVCSRQFPAWRQRRRFRIPFFGIQGFKRDLVIFIRRYGAYFPLDAGKDPSTANIVIKVASDQGILTYRDGTPFLQSQTLANRQKGLIGFAEAYDYIDALIDAGAATEEASKDNFVVGTVPVLMGRLGVNYALSAITRVSTYNIDAIQLVQTADARVYTFLVDYANRDRTLQAIANYNAYFVNAPMTTRIGTLQ